MISKSPAYPAILSRIENGDSFLDVGCYLGQDIRQLVFDGAPSEYVGACALLALVRDTGASLAPLEPYLKGFCGQSHDILSRGLHERVFLSKCLLR